MEAFNIPITEVCLGMVLIMMTVPTSRDINTLKDLNWLNDEVIKFYMKTNVNAFPVRRAQIFKRFLNSQRSSTLNL